MCCHSKDASSFSVASSLAAAIHPFTYTAGIHPKEWQALAFNSANYHHKMTQTIPINNAIRSLSLAHRLLLYGLRGHRRVCFPLLWHLVWYAFLHARFVMLWTHRRCSLCINNPAFVKWIVNSVNLNSELGFDWVSSDECSGTGSDYQWQRGMLEALFIRHL